MTLHLASWFVPALLTAAIWCTAFAKPMPAAHGPTGYGEAFFLAGRVILSTVATAAVWSGYLLLLLVIEWG